MADATTNYEVVVTDTGAPVVRRNIEGIGEGAEKSSKGVDLLNRSLALLGGYLSISKLISYSDGYQQITNQLKYATHSTQEYMAVEQELYNVSQRTYSSFDANSKLFQRMVVATSNLGTSYKDLLSFITSVNQAFALSKLSTQEVSNSLIQLAQGMSKGILNGDELRTILESAPILADALARGLNTSVGALRKMGEQGELTTKRVMDAIQKQGPRLQAEFAKLVPTIGQGWQVLSNAIERYIGQTSQATGVGSAISKSLQFLGNNIEGVTKVIGVAIAAWLAYRAALIITAVVQALVTGVSAMNAAIAMSIQVVGLAGTAFAVLRGALIGLAVATGLNPFTVMVVALTVVIGLIWAFGNAIKVNSTGSISLLGALATAWNLVKMAVTTVAQFLYAVGVAIANNETALNLCKSAASLLAAAFVAMTVTSVVGWFVAVGSAVGRLAIALASTLLWPALIITAFVSIGYIIATLTGTTDLFVQKIKEGYAKVSEMATKATTDLKGTATATDESAGMMQKLLDKSFGAASALGTTTKAVKEHTDAHHKLGQEINTDGEYWVRYWDNLIRKFHDWQMETRNFTTTFEAWNAQLRSTAAIDRYIADMEKAGILTKDWQKNLSTLGDTFDYQVGALGRLDEALAKAAGSYSYLSKEATSSTESIAKNSASYNQAQAAKNAGSDPKTYTFATWNTPDVMKAVGNAFQRAAQISVEDGVPVPEGYDKASGMFRQFVDSPARGTTIKAELIHLLSKLSGEAKKYLSNTTVGGWVQGFRDGGSFNVGGTGGPDSQLVQFMASPNERVTIEKPEQRRQRDDEPKSQRPITVNMKVVTPDADSFRRSETQTLTSLQTRIRRATG